MKDEHLRETEHNRSSCPQSIMITKISQAPTLQIFFLGNISAEGSPLLACVGNHVQSVCVPSYACLLGVLFHQSPFPMHFSGFPVQCCMRCCLSVSSKITHNRIALLWRTLFCRRRGLCMMFLYSQMPQLLTQIYEAYVCTVHDISETLVLGWVISLVTTQTLAKMQCLFWPATTQGVKVSFQPMMLRAQWVGQTHFHSECALTNPERIPCFFQKLTFGNFFPSNLFLPCTRRKPFCKETRFSWWREMFCFQAAVHAEKNIFLWIFYALHDTMCLLPHRCFVECIAPHNPLNTLLPLSSRGPLNKQTAMLVWTDLWKLPLDTKPFQGSSWLKVWHVQFRKGGTTQKSGNIGETTCVEMFLKKLDSWRNETKVEGSTMPEL